MNLPVKIAVSLLSVAEEKMQKQVSSLVRFGVDRFHLDIMDGKFVDNKTYGYEIMKKIKTKIPIDIHIMAENPLPLIKPFASFGVSTIIIHVEIDKNIASLIKQIHNFNCRAGLSINPETDLKKLLPYIDEIDLALIMSVRPGRGGQKFMLGVLQKARKLRKLKPLLDIAIDGGINKETGKLAVKSGCNILAAGSYIIHAPDTKKAIESLRHTSP